MKILKIGRPPFSEIDLSLLVAAQAPLLHPDPESESFATLGKAGFKVVALDEELPATGTLLIPVATGSVERLVQVADRLLGPGGCPWDQKQTHGTLKRYLLEETYELFEAIDRNDLTSMQEELGDVLLQPIMHAAMQSIQDGFDIDDVAITITDKLIRRHPHVFGEVMVADENEVLKNWDAIKKQEKAGSSSTSILSGVPKSLPSLLRALEVSKRAARAGFEWPNLDGVWQKIAEEEAELLEAIESKSLEEQTSELGDLLFTVVNLARWLRIEPEEALGQMVTRFSRRFEAMEKSVDGPLDQLTPEAWEEAWQQAKASAEGASSIDRS